MITKNFNDVIKCRAISLSGYFYKSMHTQEMQNFQVHESAIENLIEFNFITSIILA